MSITCKVCNILPTALLWVSLLSAMTCTDVDDASSDADELLKLISIVMSCTITNADELLMLMNC